MLIAWVICAPQALASDEQDCITGGNNNKAIEACTRAINSGAVPERRLSAMYFWRSTYYDAIGKRAESAADWAKVQELKKKYPDGPVK
jgi:hypothetical protein